MTFPVLRASTIASPQLTAAVIMKLSAPPSAPPEEQHGGRCSGCALEQQRTQVDQSGRRGRQQTRDNRALRAMAVRIVARPGSRDQRCSELTAGDEADHESAEPQSVVDVERKHRHRDADDEKGDEDCAHDRQQRNRERTRGGGIWHGYDGHCRS